MDELYLLSLTISISLRLIVVAGPIPSTVMPSKFLPAMHTSLNECREIVFAKAGLSNASWVALGLFQTLTLPISMKVYNNVDYVALMAPQSDLKMEHKMAMKAGDLS
jgi:hypothetical protein